MTLLGTPVERARRHELRAREHGAAWNLAFIPAGRDGTLSVIAFDKGVARIVQTVPTQVGARTIAEDDRDGRVYLPTAKYGPPSVAGGRPTLVPGSFEILVVGPK